MIEIAISGIILLLSGSASGGAGASIVAALAVEAADPKPSIFDVDISRHEAVLEFNTPIEVVSDAEARVEIQAQPVRLTLAGDHVVFGAFNGGTGTCDAFAQQQVREAKSMGNVPALNDLKIPSTRLETNARPSAGDFSGMRNGPVAAWLDVSRGALLASSSDDDAVEFRPTRHRQVVARVVTWRIPLGGVGCVNVTPFDPNNPGNVVLKLLGKRPRVAFTNTAVDMSDIRPAVDYDFELYYRVLDQQPAVPRLPYALSFDDVQQDHAGHDQPAILSSGRQRRIRGGTGVNCGPARLQ